MILVTGGSGYIGSVLVPLLSAVTPVRVLETMHFGNPIAKLAAANDIFNVEFMQGNICNLVDVRNAMRGVTGIVHLAGIVTDELVDMNATLGHFVNVEATRLLCQEAVNAGVERFIYASSSSVYGAQDMECWEGTEPKPQTAYARQKLAGERIVDTYKDKMWVFSVRSATACGPAPRMRLDTIVNTFCAQAYFKKKITVWGGSQYRSNIHVQDVADLYCRLALGQEHGIRSGYFINAVREYHQALELARLVQTIIPCEIVCDLTKPDVRSYRMATHQGPLMEVRFQWGPHRSIEDAIKDNLAWFESGGVQEPDADIYYNTRRMADIVQKERA